MFRDEGLDLGFGGEEIGGLRMLSASGVSGSKSFGKLRTGCGVGGVTRPGNRYWSEPLSHHASFPMTEAS
jgi:hypothetical protein